MTKTKLLKTIRKSRSNLAGAIYKIENRYGIEQDLDYADTCLASSIAWAQQARQELRQLQKEQAKA